MTYDIAVVTVRYSVLTERERNWSGHVPRVGISLEHERALEQSTVSHREPSLNAELWPPAGPCSRWFRVQPRRRHNFSMKCFVQRVLSVDENQRDCRSSLRRAPELPFSVMMAQRCSTAPPRWRTPHPRRLQRRRSGCAVAGGKDKNVDTCALAGETKQRLLPHRFRSGERDWA